ncbi:MAG: paraquat-inducible protein A [Rhodobacteraceae bacterium]|nr:paraquat-inducible protein A [Paracoccaceae bacterium]
MGLVACTRCTRVWPLGTHKCGRCGHRLHSRDPHAMQRVWAFWAVGLMCYVPANLAPMLRTRTLVSSQENTIVGGAAELAQHGNWGIAMVILVASVLIPVGKFIAIAGLALGLRRPGALGPARRQQLYEVVDYIGRWSMIDVFVVAILSSLVQLGAVASVSPGPASLFFALSVIFTMLSAQSFDSRRIWDIEAVAPPAAPPIPAPPVTKAHPA